MTQNSFRWIRTIFCVIVLFFYTYSFAQDTTTDSMLIKREYAKWEALKTGNFGLHSDWFSEDFASIGYMPDGSVYRMEKARMAKPTNAGEKGNLPTAVFELSDFKVVQASETVKIITYQADGPINLYITSTWAKRGGDWKTVFYQATKYK